MDITVGDFIMFPYAFPCPDYTFAVVLARNGNEIIYCDPTWNPDMFGSLDIKKFNYRYLKYGNFAGNIRHIPSNILESPFDDKTTTLKNLLLKCRQQHLPHIDKERRRKYPIIQWCECGNHISNLIDSVILDYKDFSMFLCLKCEKQTIIPYGKEYIKNFVKESKQKD
jgi:hypothetical protein